MARDGIDATAALPPAVAGELAAIRDGTAPRRSMDPAFYTDPAMLPAEVEGVFLSGWICLCRAEEIPTPGSYLTRDVLGEPLIVTRDGTGAIRVLSNVCRHRGSRLVDGQGTTKRFTCPYHAWTYGLDGALVRAPLIEGDLSGCHLPSFAVEEWMGWVFVNLDGTAPPHGASLADLDPHVRNYHPEEMQAKVPTIETWAVNWKALAENFMEGYHLTPVHLKTLHPMTPSRLCEKIPGGAAWTGYKSHYDDAYEGRTEVHPDMTAQEQRMSMMVWIYPGFVAAISPNSCVTMSLLPAGPEAVETRWDVLVRKGVSEHEARARHDFAASFNAEDKARLVELQKGLRSRFATGGPLAPPDLEGCIWDFYGWMAGRLMGQG
ncbi:MAG: aromatic ring-hydroxylating dioxygenase subunit alpha [Pseudomonadota bacterium]